MLPEGNLVNPSIKQKDVTVTKKYAHISYEKPNKNGLYQEAYARVGTLQQITEEVAHRATLPYQHNLFAGQEILVADGDRVKMVPGDNYFEVFDLSVVSEVIPDLRITYGVDEYELPEDVESFILSGGDIMGHEYLRDLHEELVSGQISGEFPILPFVVGGIPYREDLARLFLQDNLLLGDVSRDGGLFYGLGALNRAGDVPFDQSMLAPKARCWVHDMDDEGWSLGYPEYYWVPVQ